MLLRPASGHIIDPTDQHGYAWSGINSFDLGQWTQLPNSQVWTQLLNMTNYTDSSSLQVTFRPNMPYFNLSSAAPWVEVGTEWQPQFSVVNNGTDGGPFVATLTSSDSLIPTFTLTWPDSVRMGQTITLLADSSVQIPNDPAYWGTTMILTLTLPFNSLRTELHLMMPNPENNGYRFSYPVVEAIDSATNLSVAASHDTLFCFNADGSLRWTHVFTPYHQINSVAIGSVRSYSLPPVTGLSVACVLDSHRVFLLSDNNGQPLARWEVETGLISTPGVMIVDGYVVFVDDITLKAYDLDQRLIAFAATRTEVTMPQGIHPDAWAYMGNPIMGDSVSGGAFIFTTGLATHTGGTFFIMSAGGQLLYPEDGPYPVSTYGFNVPRVGELICGNTSYEAFWSYQDADNNGGIMVWSYSSAQRVAGIGTTEFGQAKIKSWSESITHSQPTDWMARQVYSFYVPEANHSYINIGTVTSNLGQGNAPVYTASVNLTDSVNNNRVIAAWNRELLLFNEQGNLMYGNGIIAHWESGDSIIGPPSVVRGSAEQARLRILVGNADTWTVERRSLSGSLGGEWQGWFGNSRNSGYHPYFDGMPIQQCDDDTFYVTLQPSVAGVAILRINNCHHDWLVRGIKLYSSTTYQGLDDSTLAPQIIWTRENQVWHQIELVASETKRFWYCRVIYDQAIDGAVLWGRFQLAIP